MAYDDPSTLHYRALFDVVPVEPSDNEPDFYNGIVLFDLLLESLTWKK